MTKSIYNYRVVICYRIYTRDLQTPRTHLSIFLVFQQRRDVVVPPVGPRRFRDILTVLSVLTCLSVLRGLSILLTLCLLVSHVAANSWHLPDAGRFVLLTVAHVLDWILRKRGDKVGYLALEQTISKVNSLRERPTLYSM